MATSAAGYRKPRALGPGARVALIAPAGPLAPERVETSVRRCRELELEPVVYPGAHERKGFLAGDDARRLRDLQDALDDPSIDAVWALRGGYGVTRVLRSLDLSRVTGAPKPYIGFSDNTALHAALFSRGIVSYHGPHAGGAFPVETADAFRQVLFRAEAPLALPLREADPVPTTLVGGTATGPLTGGNVALLAALCGTPYTPRASGCILFLEDVGEPAYRLDRLLVQLRDAGVLEGVVGLALGRFTEEPEGDDDAVRAVIESFARELAVPAVLDFPIGHVDHNWTLPLGVQARLNADAAALEIIEPAVRGES